ncbi:hypothetical protein SAMN04244560_00130 [Thermoanaerobacter thermohydrosulfuricus]|uniref:Uncharacterized protein n=1 Tax=Thermoanaerobacter thermohydrosulfuricus TaxID=1516 RepID=A0A1G7HS58_THETY|nr:hypothetical protein [Thermoanaerobacter thermohydrosulfuricus]SDF02849.1 hypothetical protein SAMN04244560_00130 [Thermoanaerobacter thermohydrosulfuricus]
MNTQHIPAVIYKEPELFYEAKIREEILKRYNIAFEVFMAEQYSKIHYSELMEDDVDESLASRQRLISWINDNTRGKETRAGILTKYMLEHPEHFENGIWQARYFSYFVYYAKNLLTDETFVKKKQIADEFKKSFKNEEWYWKAVAVLGAKLLEYLYDMNALQTDIAKAYVRQIKLSRQLLKSIGKITGRVAKNFGENYGYDSIEEVREAIFAIKQSIEETFKQQMEMSYKIFTSQKEYRIYLAYHETIKNDILEIYKEVPKLPEQKAVQVTIMEYTH